MLEGYPGILKTGIFTYVNMSNYEAILNKIFKPMVDSEKTIIQPPKPNTKSNLRNLQLTIKALRALIASYHSVLPQSAIDALLSFADDLTLLYQSDVAQFVGVLKRATVWMGRWIMSSNSEQGVVTDDEWDDIAQAPVIMIGVIAEFMQFMAGSKERRIFASLMLTILNSYRNVVVPKALDTSSITSPSKSVPFDEYELRTALKELGFEPSEFQKEFNKRAAFRRMHYTTSSGPNGPALLTAHLDAKAVLKDIKLSSALKDWCMYTGQMKVWESMLFADKTSLKGRFWPAGGIKDLIHSKLHVIYEKGDKSRVIAIADYWTQEAMSALHDTINHFLKTKVPQDYTFNQDAGVQKVREMTGSKHFDRISSLDLTAATDRLPVWYQAKILSILFGHEKYGQMWSAVMRNRSFQLSGTKDFYRYAVGQPMGIKSSFAMLSLMHHVIVKVSALKIGVRSFTDYTLLGDDIVIGGYEVAQSYRRYMDQLDCSIAEYKSVFAHKSGHFGAEFCKRVIVNGEDWSPIPPGILLRVAKSGRFAPQFQNELQRRGLIQGPAHFWILMKNLVSVRYFKLLSVMNGMPSSVTGLIHPIPNLYMPFCNSTFIATLSGLQVQDWANVSEFIDARNAVASSCKVLHDTWAAPVSKIMSDALLKLGFENISIEADYKLTADNMGRKNMKLRSPYLIDWPVGFDALKKVAKTHPFMQYILDHLLELHSDLEYFARTDHTLTPWNQSKLPKFFSRRLLLSNHIVKLTRELEDQSAGIKSFTHIYEVLKIMRRWVKNPNDRRTVFSTRVPMLMEHLTLIVRAGHKMSVHSSVPHMRNHDMDALMRDAFPKFKLIR